MLQDENAKCGARKLRNIHSAVAINCLRIATAIFSNKCVTIAVAMAPMQLLYYVGAVVISAHHSNHTHKKFWLSFNMFMVIQVSLRAMAEQPTCMSDANVPSIYYSSCSCHSTVSHQPPSDACGPVHGHSLLVNVAINDATYGCKERTFSCAACTGYSPFTPNTALSGPANRRQLRDSVSRVLRYKYERQLQMLSTSRSS